MKNINLSSFALVLIGILLVNCTMGKREQVDPDYYPSASRFANVLYVLDAKSKEGNIKTYAAHLVLNGKGELIWEQEIVDAGEYEVILGYSVRKNGATASIAAGSDVIADSLDITEGVYEENKDWYQFNCVRKLLKGTLNLSKGSNSIKLRIDVPDSAFESIIYALELVPLDKKSALISEVTEARKARPEMDWFRSMKYGVMFHWTSQSAPQSGPIILYPDAVRNFNVEAFVDMVTKTGADYVIFTGNHAEPHFPGPLKAWEKEYPGSTTERDLISEISDSLESRNIKFILYLATHIYAKQDKVDSKEFERLNIELISEIGERYKEKIDGFWFDGFYQSYKSHPDFDFQKFYEICKRGNSDRLITLNSWLYPIVSEWQDYWAGEVYTPGTIPESHIIEKGPGKGLQFHSLVVLENDWVHEKLNTRIPSPRLETDKLINYISSCTGKGPVTINLGIYQDGTISDEALAAMEEVNEHF